MADGSHLQEGVDLGAIAAALGITKRSAERRSNREKWPFTARTIRGGQQRSFALQQLPVDVQAALLLKQSPTIARTARSTVAWPEARIEAAWQRYARLPDERKSTAKHRQRALLAVEGLQRGGLSLGQARASVAEQLQAEDGVACSVRSLKRWAQSVEGCPRDTWLAALVDDYAGGTASIDVPAEAWDLFKSDYLRLEAPTAQSCYNRLKRAAAIKGWTLPTLRTLERHLEREIPRQVIVLAREGTEALDRTYPAQQRDRSVFTALEGCNADGHKFDVFVRFPDETIGRPIMVCVQDLYSGKLIGYRVGETESADLARLAFGDVVRNYGIPRHAWLDNGRGFASKYLTGGTRTRYRFKVREEDPVGLLVGLGIDVHWATPYHGQAKPIERAFRDLCDTVAKHPAFAGAYTGNRPDAKPENYASRAVPFDTFLRVLSEEIVAHNALVGRRSAVCDGRSFDQAFAASYADAPVRKATAEQLRLLLLSSEAVTANAQDGSVRLAGNRYWDEALVAHASQKLVLRFDPDNLHGTVGVYTLGGAFVCDADCTARVGFADTNAGREHSRARKQYRRAAKDMLKAQRRMDASEVAAQVPPPAGEVLPDAKVISGLFERRERPAEPLARTGTDNLPQRDVQLGDLLLRLQRQQDAHSLDGGGEG
jgi:putative transposase